jgi:hypothetical protein
VRTAGNDDCVMRSLVLEDSVAERLAHVRRQCLAFVDHGRDKHAVVGVVVLTTW